jgi:predicted flavoprotein YhiN
MHEMGRVIVVGAGAAGITAAIFAARAGAETLLLERTRDGGRKILISGGGRCNVLPSRVDLDRFVTDSSPNTLRKIVRAWPLPELVEFFEREVGVPLEEETASAKLFPRSHKARDVRDGLLALALRSGVALHFDTRVTNVIPPEEPGAAWTVAVDGQPSLRADAVIVATGGLSVPATGSDGTGLRVLAALGHTMHDTYAALTPLTSTEGALGDLSGISLTVSITATTAARRATARGGFLFTHRGYSGPSVLNVSHVATRALPDHAHAGGGNQHSASASGQRQTGDVQPALQVQWTPLDEAGWNTRLQTESAQHGARQVATLVRGEMPERLADALLKQAGVDPTRRLADLTRDERRRLVDALVRSPLPCTGSEGYKKAEVTGGGVALAEIDPRTMESRRHAGLYLCGEVLDCFGPIGGYNFLWAWVTGRAAGQAAGAPARLTSPSPTPVGT